MIDVYFTHYLEEKTHFPIILYEENKKAIVVDVHASYNLPVLNQDTCLNNTNSTTILQIQLQW